MGTVRISPKKQWITVEEMASYLGIGRSKAYELVRQKGFPSIKIGKVIRVSLSQLESWLENQSMS